MCWTVLVLILKANVDNQGIGLIEVVWEVVEAVIDTQIKSVVQLHEFSSQVSRREGVGGHLSSMDQDPLLLVFLDTLIATQ